MSFDHEMFKNELCKHLRNRLGWSDDIAHKASDIASDVVMRTHGGERHYIQARIIDKDGIKADRAGGMRIEQISRKHGVSNRTIMRVIGG